MGMRSVSDDDYLDKINQIKQPNTKMELLQQLLKKAIGEFKKTNKVKSIDFSKKMNAIVQEYNERDESNIMHSTVMKDFTDQIIDIIYQMRDEVNSYQDMGIDFEQKAFYDILLTLANKYDFSYPEDNLIKLSKAVKDLVDDKAQYTDWNKRNDIKAELEFDLNSRLMSGYPPIDRDEVYTEIFDQAEQFKKGRACG